MMTVNHFAPRAVPLATICCMAISSLAASSAFAATPQVTNGTTQFTTTVTTSIAAGAPCTIGVTPPSSTTFTAQYAVDDQAKATMNIDGSDQMRYLKVVAGGGTSCDVTSVTLSFSDGVVAGTSSTGNAFYLRTSLTDARAYYTVPDTPGDGFVDGVGLCNAGCTAALKPRPNITSDGPLNGEYPADNALIAAGVPLNSRRFADKDIFNKDVPYVRLTPSYFNRDTVTNALFNLRNGKFYFPTPDATNNYKSLFLGIGGYLSSTPLDGKGDLQLSGVVNGESIKLPFTVTISAS